MTGRHAGQVLLKCPHFLSDPGNVHVQINKHQARAERFLAADKANVYTVRRARLIYESERAGFMADHKSVSAQLTLGNFPTTFSNQTPSLASSQGDPPRASWGCPRRVEVGGRWGGQRTWREERSKIRRTRGGRHNCKRGVH